MRMVRILKLILNDYATVLAEVAGQDVHREVANRVLARDNLEIESQRLRQHVYVLYYPWREVESFVLPNVSQIDSAKAAEVKSGIEGISNSLVSAAILYASGGHGDDGCGQNSSKDAVLAMVKNGRVWRRSRRSFKLQCRKRSPIATASAPAMRSTGFRQEMRFG